MTPGIYTAGDEVTERLNIQKLHPLTLTSHTQRNANFASTYKFLFNLVGANHAIAYSNSVPKRIISQ